MSIAQIGLHIESINVNIENEYFLAVLVEPSTRRTNTAHLAQKEETNSEALVHYIVHQTSREASYSMKNIERFFQLQPSIGGF